MPRAIDPHTPYFRGVALALIFCGAGIIAVGLVELGSNLLSDTAFHSPAFKVIGGLIVTALGYVHLELELLRVK
jgi:uncharacterized protein involved in response to NO